MQILCYLLVVRKRSVDQVVGPIDDFPKRSLVDWMNAFDSSDRVRGRLKRGLSTLEITCRGDVVFFVVNETVACGE